MIVFLISRVVQAYSRVEISYLVLITHSFIMIFVWNLFDLFIMDWLIFSTITPKYLIVPGTEGHPSYKNYKHHINGSLGKGVILALLAGIVVSALALVILKVFYV